MNFRSVKITPGGYRNHYILLSDILDFFPSELIGGSNEDEAGQRATIYFGISEPVMADIDGEKNFFRVRGPLTRRFFEAHQLKAGDRVIFEKVGHHEYHLYPQRAI
ncbi:hypothetical protein DOQ08_02408 [Marinobacter litoralis]|uniref:Uncharacterized protein n=1 Tax=Marinobacter litoralis TaxID=187981 RepID=A0A3M2RCB5_9GAMM|nr:hypothetical protein [Marinobacter litoralis]RMJ02943.1 hypothetical protein DOQ08_02408 [Marinobacter litoralis]